MKMRPFSKREKGFFYILLALFFLAALYYYLIIPSFSKFNQINQDIEKKSSILERYSRLLTKRKDIVLLYESQKSNLEADIDSQKITTDLFENIKEAAKSFNLNLETIKPQPIEDKKDHKVVVLTIEAEGNFASIFQFINRIENLSSLIRVSSLRIFSSSRRSRGLRCRVTFSKIFF